MIEQLLSFAGLSAPDNDSGSNGKGSQVQWTVPGTYEWTVPDNVFNISVVVVSAGGRGKVQANVGAAEGGTGGFNRWKNNIPVQPGEKYTIVVGSGGISETIPFTVASGTQSDYMSSAFGLNVGITAAETTPKSAEVGGGNGAAGRAGNQNNSSFQGGNAGMFNLDTTTQTNPAMGISLINVYVAGLGLNGGACGGGGSAQSRLSGSRVVGKGGDGGVRIIWGRNRAYPTTAITDR